ncbi:signal peptide protein [Ectothiorhodospira haloalkaliphila]|uniref:Signal peptide protein n=2 Tax=Ectothiorhodospira haloalkaliphila TaxID=421628 RepID=W8KFI2_9GAMM|nr:signal peptide protein [Ectothiorhodospira haloalkaliphila]
MAMKSLPRLIINTGETLRGTVALGNKPITIGRRPDNDIRLDNLAVSGYHAQLIPLLNDIILEDLNSTNGTLVNDQSVRKRVLLEGDRIAIGSHELLFTRVPPEDMTEDQDPDPPEETLIVTTRTGKNPSDGASAGATRAPGHTPLTHGACLQVLTGAQAGREWPLTKALTTIGSPGVQVAAISRRGDTFHISRVEGGSHPHAPRLNGEDLGTQPRALQHQDVIEIAGVSMEFIDRSTLSQHH